jgi:hypothetical protein
MSDKLDPRQTTSIEEVLVATVFQQEAMMNLLERKGLLTRAEVMSEILELKKKRAKAK